MKNRILVILFLLCIISCKKSISTFNAQISTDDITFTPIAGGAVMHYKLPKDAGVYTIKATYENFRGEKYVKLGSYLCDSMELMGFNEAKNNIPVEITLTNNENIESTPIKKTFSTYDSGPVQFFNNLKIVPSWGGFQMMYTCPEKAQGLVHVMYLGTNPTTQRQDSLLLQTFPITQGTDTVTFPLQQIRGVNTIIVRADDIRGYRAKQHIFENVESYEIKKMTIDDFTFNTNNLSLEVEANKVGVKYLFDGDSKGYGCMKGKESSNYHTFIAGPRASNKPFIFELKEEQTPARIKFYSILNMANWPYKGNIIDDIWKGIYHNKLPNEITIYATNDKENRSSWSKIGYFFQNRSMDMDNRWTARSTQGQYKIYSENDLYTAEECSIQIDFIAKDEKYKYIIVEFNMLFDNGYGSISDWFDQNPLDYVTLNEIELFVKKD